MSEKTPNGFNWSQYNERIEKRPPRELCVAGLELVAAYNSALDFGAGSLTDTKQILEAGFEEVIAIDASEDSQERANQIDSESLTFVQTTFEDYDFPIEQFDFINAQNSIAFISRDAFNRVMNKLINSLKSQGVIAANFFGDKDEWNTPDTNKSFVTLDEVENMFTDFSVINLTEEEVDKPTALGHPKHWHIINLLAIKN